MALVRRWFANDELFLAGVAALLRDGQVRMLDDAGVEVPAWRWSQLLSTFDTVGDILRWRLELTDRGANTIA